MNIDRHNYEEFFLLYVDNELSASERKAVEEFVTENADLKTELDLMKEAVLQPEKTLSFDFKASLMKPVASESMINENNCEEFFLLYADDELDNAGKSQVEEFVYDHPQYQADFELLLHVKMTPDTHLVFPGKSQLYRKEKDDKVVPFGWWKIMAAAVVLLAVGFATWFLLNTSNNNPEVIAKTDPVNPVVTQPAPSTEQKDVPVNEGTTASTSSTQKTTDAALDASNRKIDNRIASLPVDKKNVEEPRNIPTGSNVPPVDNTIAKVEKPEVVVPEKIVINEVKPTTIETTASLVNNYPVSADADLKEFQEEGNSDIVFVANTSVNKKSKLRGVFRKASRFLEKATNLEPGSRGVRVANVEIGLK